MVLELEKLVLSKTSSASNDKHWFYQSDTVANDTPSRKMGMSYEMEMKLRRDGIRFLTILDEGAHTYQKQYRSNAQYNPKLISAAAVFFHRFYMMHPFQIFDRYEIATTCYHLAAKSEDCPFSISSVAVYACHVMALLGSKVEGTPAELEEELRTLELFLIETLGFMFCVRHPTLYIEFYVNELFGDAKQLKYVQNVANEFAKASLGSILMVTTDPRALAIACITWACKKLHLPLNNWKRKEASCTLDHWCESFNMPYEFIEHLYKIHEAHAQISRLEQNEVVRAAESTSQKKSPFLQAVIQMNIIYGPSHASPKKTVDQNDNELQYPSRLAQNSVNGGRALSISVGKAES